MKKIIILLLVIFFLQNILASTDNYPGKAINFDGQDDYISVNDDNSLDLTVSYTIEAWIKPDSFGLLDGIVSKYQSGGAMGYMLRLGRTAPYTGLEFDEMKTGNGILEAGKWYHLAAVNNNGTRHLYVNGVEVELWDTAINVMSNNDPLTIGVDFLADPRYFDGTIDEVRIWNVARSVKDIRENMNLSLTGTEAGLVSYWQFNSGSGVTVTDNAGNNDGVAVNTSGSCWVTSTIPFGSGFSNTQIVSGMGQVTFSGTGCAMNFTSKTGTDTIVVAKIDTTPNILPTDEKIKSVLDNRYWVIHSFGNGTFTANITFSPAGTVENCKYGLYWRDSEADGNWQLQDTTSAVNTGDNSITFHGINNTGQFIIAAYYNAGISVDTSLLDFSKVYVNDSSSLSFTVYNTGTDTLFVSQISSGHTFIRTIDKCVVAPDSSKVINVMFKPQRDMELNTLLELKSNDLENEYTYIHIIGKAVTARVIAFDTGDVYGFHYLTGNFDNIDVGEGSTPVFADIDGDGLLDLFIGNTGGKIFRYEQSQLNSTIFTLITQTFNGINTGSYLSPAFADIDSDGLWDLFVGNSEGNILHYEQEGLNSDTFQLVSSKFNGIDTGDTVAMAFSDFNGNGKLDLLIGNYDGKIYYYEQNSANDTAFQLISADFNGIDVGNNAKPCIEDIDGDGLYDLLIGNSDGQVSRYEQTSQYGTSFSLVAQNFDSIDAGNNAAPVLFDINGDGLFDLLIGNDTGTLQRYAQENVTLLSFKCYISDSVTKSYFLKGMNLQSDVTLETSNDFTLSLSSVSNFKNTLTIASQLCETGDTVFVKFKPSNTGNYTAGIQHISTGMDTIIVSLEAAVFDLSPGPGNAIRFNGQEYVRVEDDNSLDLVNNYTIEAWIKPESFDFLGGIVSKYQQPGTAGYLLRLGSTPPYTGLEFDEMKTDNGILEAGKWYHIAAVNDNGTRHLYVNGKEVALSGTPLTVKVNDDFLGIGVDYFNAARYFDGEIDEVRIWNIARPVNEIRENMHLKPDNLHGLVSYWQFNEENGDTLYEQISGNNGIMQNMSGQNRVVSSLDFAEGGYAAQTVINTGTVDFPGTDVKFDLTYIDTQTIFSVYKMNQTPNQLPDRRAVDKIYDDRYWIIRYYGDGTFKSAISFTVAAPLDINTEQYPYRYKLFARKVNSNEQWQFLSNATDVNASTNTVTFSDVKNSDFYSGALEFLVCYKEEKQFLTAVYDPYRFKLMNENFSNININSDHLCPVVSDIDNDGLYDILVGLSDGRICHYKQDALDSYSFSLVSGNFSSIYISSGNVSPFLTDLDGNGKLDLLVGHSYLSGQSKISHYEQDSVNALTFSLITDNFNNLTFNGTPVYIAADYVDDDNRLDLLIGENEPSMYLHYYEQDSPDSGVFSLVTDRFIPYYKNGMAPRIAGLQGNGLLDLVVGNNNPDNSRQILTFYKQDSIYSLNYNKIRALSSSLYSNSFVEPCDIDNDGLTDILIGTDSNVIRHYEQESITKLDFHKILPDRSKVMSFFVKSGGFNDSLTVSVTNNPDLFKVSLSAGGNFTDNISIPYSPLGIGDTVFVKFAPFAYGNYTGNIVITNGVSAPLNIVLKGVCGKLDSIPQNAFKFNGSDCYALSEDLPVVLDSSSWSLEFWANAEDFNDGGIFQFLAQGNNNYDFSLQTCDTTNKWKLNIAGLQRYINLPDSKNNWHHYCITYNTNSLRFYYDGKQVDSVHTALQPLEANLYLGKRYDFNDDSYKYFAGSIDELRFWNKTLSTGQIREAMNINLENDLQDLAVYWQFNEPYIDTLFNPLSSVDGVLYNAGSTAWINSAIPFGFGAVSTRGLNTTGTVSFDNTGLTMNVTQLSDTGDYVVARIDTTPNTIPALQICKNTIGDQYWVTHKYGIDSIKSDMTFLVSGNIVGGKTYVLYSRASYSDGSWDVCAQSSSVDTVDNSVMFNGVTASGQFIIGEPFDASLSLNTDTLDFGVISGVSTLPLEITNNGTDTLKINDIVTGNVYLSTDKNSILIPPGNSDTLFVTFSPLQRTTLNRFIKLSTNDINNIEKTVFVKGKGSSPKVNFFNNDNFQYKLIDGDFAGINTISSSAPFVTDIDNDGLFDLVIGNGQKLLRYEQDSLHSLSFSLATGNLVATQDTGLVPVVTDIDGDLLLDLLVGNSNGTIFRFEQDSLNNPGFSLVTDNFNSIDVGTYSAPAVSDIDNNGLLDMIVGNHEGTLSYFEQDSVNSCEFSLVTGNFNNIDAGEDAKPAFTDIDHNGLLDLYIGNSAGEILHYKQDSINPELFVQYNDDVDSIDTGNQSAPAFSDIDGNGLVDMLLGNAQGKIKRYEEKSIDSLFAGNCIIGDSLRSSYYIRAFDMPQNLEIKSSEIFTVSFSKYSDFDTVLSVSPQDGKISDTLFVMFKPAQYENYQKNISHKSGATCYKLNVSGNGINLSTKSGTALCFDGNDDFINCGNGPVITSDNPRTVEFWAYTESFNNGGVFQAGTASGTGMDFSFRTLTEDNKWRMQTWGSTDFDVTLPESKNQWHHYAITYDGDSLKVYYDGELKSSKQRNLITGSSQFYIGAWQNDYFHGKIEEMRVWNRALSGDEIRNYMHLPEAAFDTTGLVSYWQFNDSAGNVLRDIFPGNNDGALQNMDENCWISSNIPTGKGIFDEKSVSDSSAVDFYGTDVAMFVNEADTFEYVTVTKLLSAPNNKPEHIHFVEELFDNQYWVVHQYSGNNLNADVTFKVYRTLNAQKQYSLLFRAANATDGNWEVLETAGTVNVADSTLTFNNVSSFGQFIIARTANAHINITPDTLDFHKVKVGDSLTLVLTVSNTGTDTLNVNKIIKPGLINMSVEHFSVPPQSSINLDVTFKPVRREVFSGKILFFSNNYGDEIDDVVCVAEGYLPQLVPLKGNKLFVKKDDDFNSIDTVGGRFNMTFTDLTFDGLLDILVGEYSGNVNYFKQDSINSLSFSYITDNFSNVKVNRFSAPVVADIDHDNLLDILVGNLSGRIVHYEQDTAYSLSFSKVADRFCNIFVGQNASPVLTDLDNDSLYDLLIGAYNGKIVYYRQDSANSSSFTLVNDNFNSIDVGKNCVPLILDFDNDGLLDLLAGANNGRIFYYKQDSINALTFTLVTDDFGNNYFGSYTTCASSDIDSDGLTDLIISNYGSVKYYEQEDVSQIDFSRVLVGSRNVKYFYLKTIDLTGDVNISVNSDYYISLSEDSGYGQSLTLSPVNGRVSDTVFINFAPGDTLDYSTDLVIVSQQAQTKTIHLTGKGMRISDYPGKDLFFKGENGGYVNCGQETVITGGNPRTVEFWAFAKDFNDAGAFQAGIGNEDGRDFSLRTTGTDNVWRMQTWGSTDFDVTLPDSKNSWHHYAVTYDGDTLKVFYDGQLKGWKKVMLNTGNSDFYIGKWQNKYFSGYIDEVRVWNIVRTQDEIRKTMHIPLTGFEYGLVGYWQMNETDGDKIFDPVSFNTGTFVNSGAVERSTSPVPFGPGNWDSRIISSTGTVDFAGTGLTIDVLQKSGTDTLSVTAIEANPNRLPRYPRNRVFKKYWILHKYGDGTFKADFTFKLPAQLDDTKNYALLTRETNSVSRWSYLSDAVQTDTGDSTVTFENIEHTGQFIIVEKSRAHLVYSPDTINFASVEAGDSVSLNVKIFNYGTDTLVVNNIITHSFVSTDKDNCVVAPGDSSAILFTFNPLTACDLDTRVSLVSNDSCNYETLIPLKGVAFNPELLVLDGESFDLVDSSIIHNNNYCLKPEVTDIDGDGLADILAGCYSGTILHYEQDSINSTSFTLITDRFNGIKERNYSNPVVTDLNGDGLLDLLVANNDGKIEHYIQDGLFSLSFYLESGNFSGIYDDILAAPAITDIDGDDLLDLFIGGYYGKISRYEQDSINSFSFSFVTDNFNGIDVGCCSDPEFTDIDGDNLLDLFIGNSKGVIYHFEQDTVNGETFSIVSANFSDIDVGNDASPVFCDINNDGVPDLFSGSTWGDIFYFSQHNVSGLQFNTIVNDEVVKHIFIKNIYRTQEVNISVTNDFSISFDESSGYFNSLSYTPDEGITYKNLYVKFVPDIPGIYSGTLTIQSQNTTPKNIALTATYNPPGGFPGTALTFDGVDDYVDCGNNDALNLTAGLTLEAWIKADQWAPNIWQGTIIGKDKWESYSAKGYVLRCGDNGGLSLTLGINGGWKEVAAGSLMETGKWYHVAGTYDGNKMVLYLNGKQVASKMISGTIAKSSGNLFIGSTSGYSDRFFSGTIDEVRIWNRALTPDDIRESMHLPVKSDKGLIAYWQLNESDSTQIHDLMSNITGNLMNMDSNSWVSSTIPFGKGYSNTQTVSSPCTVQFTNTGLTADINSKSGTDIFVVSRIDTLPNIIPSSPDSVLYSQYWIINKYGNGLFNWDLTFTLPGQLKQDDENNPSRISLYHRYSTSHTDWSLLKYADSVNAAANTVTFRGLSQTGQFVLARENRDTVNLVLKVLLEGAYNSNGLMDTLSRPVPLSQPFNTAPWNYFGNETVSSVSPDIVDWILIELRDTTEVSAATGETAVARRAALLSANGYVLDPYTKDTVVKYPVTISDSLFVVIWHRNHLGIISSNPLRESDRIYHYDFRTPTGQAYGINAQKFLEGGFYGMISGDADGNGTVDTADYQMWRNKAGKSGYKGEDFNLDGQVSNTDKNGFWLPNQGKHTNIPD